MEIDPIDSSVFEVGYIDPIPSSAPKGLAAIPDTIQCSAPKPAPVARILSAILLTMFQTVTWMIRTVKSFFEDSHPKHLYQKLHQIALNKDPEQIREFFAKHANETTPTAYLFSEFLSLPELFSHLPSILQGANICLDGDKGFFCRRWKEHPECYKRISSHQYQGDECYAIDHLLFWMDAEGNTRFQFENSQWRGFFSAINHIIDFLRYRRDNEQQGIIGTSPHTEDYCLKIAIDRPTHFGIRTCVPPFP